MPVASLTLITSGLLALASTLVYSLVGALMLRRGLEDARARFAMRMFAAWWFGLAAITLLNGFRDGLAAIGIVSVPLHASLGLVSMVPLSGALFGLTYYLLFIYFGRPSLAIPLAVFHVGLLTGLTYLLVALEPTGVDVGTWAASVSYANEPSPGASGILIAAILGPALMAAVAFATLYFQADQKTTRYRIAVVAGAFIGWFGVSLVATLTGWNDLAWWPLASRAVGLVATGFILAAYRPPRWVQKRLGVDPLDKRKPQPASGDPPPNIRPRAGA